MLSLFSLSPLCLLELLLLLRQSSLTDPPWLCGHLASSSAGVLVFDKPFFPSVQIQIFNFLGRDCGAS